MKKKCALLLIRIYGEKVFYAAKEQRIRFEEEEEEESLFTSGMFNKVSFFIHFSLETLSLTQRERERENARQRLVYEQQNRMLGKKRIKRMTRGEKRQNINKRAGRENELF